MCFEVSDLREQASARAASVFQGGARHIVFFLEASFVGEKLTVTRDGAVTEQLGFVEASLHLRSLQAHTPMLLGASFRELLQLGLPVLRSRQGGLGDLAAATGRLQYVLSGSFCLLQPDSGSLVLSVDLR